ncbi:MAG: hypothetical protein ACRCZP_14460 [Phycicoccus sp.]
MIKMRNVSGQRLAMYRPDGRAVEPDQTVDVDGTVVDQARAAELGASLPVDATLVEHEDGELRTWAHATFELVPTTTSSGAGRPGTSESRT